MILMCCERREGDAGGVEGRCVVVEGWGLWMGWEGYGIGERYKLAATRISSCCLRCSFGFLRLGDRMTSQ